MTVRPAVASFILISICCACTGHRAPPARASLAIPPESNAANIYWKLWSEFTPEQYEAVRAIRFSSARVEHDHHATMPLDRALGIVGASRPLVLDLVRATELRSCNWGVVPNSSSQVDKTIHESLEANIIETQYLLTAAAARAWSRGEVDDAFDRMTAIIRFSRQLTSAPSLQIALMNSSVLEGALQNLEAMLSSPDGSRIDGIQISRLKEALDALDKSDPTGINRSAAAEQYRRNHRVGDWFDSLPDRLQLQVAAVRAMATK